MGIMLSSFYDFAKSIQFTVGKNQKTLIIAWCLLWAFLFGAGPFLLPLALFWPLVCLLSIAFAFLLSRRKLETAVASYLLAFGIAYCLHYISLLPISTIITIFIIGSEQAIDAPIHFNHPIYILIYALTAILQLILSILLFRIRRLRKGFPFIFNKHTIVLALVSTGIILIFVTWASILTTSYGNVYAVYLFTIGVLVVGLGIYILIRRLIKMFQRKRAEQNTAAHYEKLYFELKEKHEEKAVSESRRVIIHNYKERIKAAEEKAIESGDDEFLRDVQRLKKDLQAAEHKGKPILPSTNNKMIDKLFERFARKCADDNIDFHIMLNGSIKYMTEHIIEQGDLETLIVNHLEDARIAVNASDSPLRKVAVMMGLSGDHCGSTCSPDR